MKISSSATVLGGIAELEQAKTILDIGTGTGLLALMAAQRNAIAQITAIELEDAAAEQAKENFQNSRWNNRLNLIHSDVLSLPVDFGFFEIILCNPPFFQGHLPSKDKKRNLARHSSELNPDSLAKICRNFLDEKGKVWLLIAETTFSLYEKAFLGEGFHICTQYSLKDKPDTVPFCRVISFSKEAQPFTTEIPFCLRASDNPYSPEIRHLLKDFLIVL